VNHNSPLVQLYVDVIDDGSQIVEIGVQHHIHNPSQYRQLYRHIFLDINFRQVVGIHQVTAFPMNKTYLNVENSDLSLFFPSVVVFLCFLINLFCRSI
jgi:hypothetical protein